MHTYRRILSTARTLLDARGYTPHERALGAALGVAVGLLPILPFQLLLLGAICIPVRCYRPLAFFTVWILNPLTFIPIYMTEYFIGTRLLNLIGYPQPHFDSLSFREIWSLGPFVLLAFLIGGLIVSFIAGIATYFPLKYWLVAKNTAPPNTSNDGVSV